MTKGSASVPLDLAVRFRAKLNSSPECDNRFDECKTTNLAEILDSRILAVQDALAFDSTAKVQPKS